MRQVIIICIIAISAFLFSDVSEAICVCCKEINDFCCETQSYDAGNKTACCHAKGFSVEKPQWTKSSECDPETNSGVVPHVTEWFHFLHLETSRYIGNPKKTNTGFGMEGDGGTLVFGKSSAGEHAICDIFGNSLKLGDVKDGMYVKILAKNVHWRGYDFLFTSENDPNWGYCYYDKLRLNYGPLEWKDNAKQTWRVQKDPSDSKFHFESIFWDRGNFLSGKEKDWLYTDDAREMNWWKVTPASN